MLALADDVGTCEACACWAPAFTAPGPAGEMVTKRGVRVSITAQEAVRHLEDLEEGNVTKGKE